MAASPCTNYVHFNTGCCSKEVALKKLYSVLQIRRDKRDNLGIISHVSPYKHIL